MLSGMALSLSVILHLSLHRQKQDLSVPQLAWPGDLQMMPVLMEIKKKKMFHNVVNLEDNSFDLLWVSYTQPWHVY